MSVQYSKEEYDIAKNVSCFDYLVANGYEVERHGQHHKLKIHDSLVLFQDGGFKWYSKDGISGNAIALLKELEGKPLNIVIKELAEFGGGVRSPTINNHSKNNLDYRKNVSQGSEVSKLDTEKEFILPKKNNSTKRVFEYLTIARGLTKEVVDYAVTNNLVYQDKNGNCIFVGYDEKQEPKFATVRGTYEKVYRKDIAGSSKDCGFSVVNKNSNVLYVFESAIDSLSMMSINNFVKDNYLSLNGVSLGSLENFLKHNQNIDTIVTCLDNDKAGRNATKKIWANYKDSYNLKYYSLFAKDINEQLLLDKIEPEVIILESDNNKLSVGDIYSFKEMNKIFDDITDDGDFKIQILQDNKELMTGYYSNYTRKGESFATFIDRYIDDNLKGLKELQSTLNSVENVDGKSISENRADLHQCKCKLMQLSKVCAKFNESELKEKSNNSIKEKVGVVKNEVNKSTVITKTREVDR